MNKISVVEIFGPTIQGEGPNVGARCIFVRVKGCDFKCDFCDSKFTWAGHDSNVEKYTDDELISHLNRLCESTNCNRIVLTGGNPCLYDFTCVLDGLTAEVDVETQGSIIPEWLPYVDTVVFSPKVPSSGMPDTFDKIAEYLHNQMHVHQTIAIKVPVFTQEDLEFARKYAAFVNEFNETAYSDIHLKMYLSVGNSDVDTTDPIRDRVLSDYENLLCVINEHPEDIQNVFILPQLHTLVWGNKQGV